MMQFFIIVLAIIISIAPITISFWFPTTTCLITSRKTNYYDRPIALAYSEEFNISSTNTVPSHNNSIATGTTDRFQYKVCGITFCYLETTGNCLPSIFRIPIFCCIFFLPYLFCDVVERLMRF